MSDAPQSEPAKPPQWKPLAPLERRVIGVLVEKAKTTPEQYPLTLNSLVTGCNQKNNRDPQMNVQAEDVEESIERLRAAGALVEVQGSGRVPKYRHMMYDWLGVTKVELGVMTELLLRGAQTEGELRGRAARMDPIADLAALRPIIESLRAKKLIVSLTGEGRGHMLTHNLYRPDEMAALRIKFGEGHVATSAQATGDPPKGSGVFFEPPQQRPAPVMAHDGGSKKSPDPIARPSPSELLTATLAQASRELESLRAELSELRREVEELNDRLSRNEDDLRQMRESLGG
jgi:hypothetical protein